ncbi:MAG: hypothetical protein IKE29_22005 [Paenibacillus sp.]|nr:hypothetical protein [Paenibacillus sp.]
MLHGGFLRALRFFFLCTPSALLICIFNLLSRSSPRLLYILDHASY